MHLHSPGAWCSSRSSSRCLEPSGRAVLVCAPVCALRGRSPTTASRGRPTTGSFTTDSTSGTARSRSTSTSTACRTNSRGACPAGCTTTRNMPFPMSGWARARPACSHHRGRHRQRRRRRPRQGSRPRRRRRDRPATPADRAEQRHPDQPVRRPAGGDAHQRRPGVPGADRHALRPDPVRAARLADPRHRSVVAAAGELPVHAGGDRGGARPPDARRRVRHVQLLPRGLAGRPATRARSPQASGTRRASTASARERPGRRSRWRLARTGQLCETGRPAAAARWRRRPTTTRSRTSRRRDPGALPLGARSDPARVARWPCALVAGPLRGHAPATPTCSSWARRSCCSRRRAWSSSRCCSARRGS